jgi:hypothetical protein
MMDIENLMVGRPWATILDRRAMQDAWNKGVEWAYGSSCIQGRLNKAQDTFIQDRTGCAGTAK